MLALTAKSSRRYLIFGGFLSAREEQGQKFSPHRFEWDIVKMLNTQGLLRPGWPKGQVTPGCQPYNRRAEMPLLTFPLPGGHILPTFVYTLRASEDRNVVKLSSPFLLLP